jgi:hypothetical protein
MFIFTTEVLNLRHFIQTTLRDIIFGSRIPSLCSHTFPLKCTCNIHIRAMLCTSKNIQSKGTAKVIFFYVTGS